MNNSAEHSIENTRVAIGTILADLREQKGLTKHDVAQALYVSDSTISHYEKGITMPTTEMIIRLAKFYDVTTDYLLNNCITKINYSKVMNKKISQGFSIGSIVEIFLSASAAEKQALLGVIKLISDKRGK